MHVGDRERAIRQLDVVCRRTGRLCLSPLWHRRAARAFVDQRPELTLIPGTRFPRRRPAMIVTTSGSRLDSDVVEALAEFCAPSAPVRWLGRVAMWVVVRLRGTSRFDTGRFVLGRQQ
jgi:hypothetical protein